MLTQVSQFSLQSPSPYLWPCGNLTVICIYCRTIQLLHNRYFSVFIAYNSLGLLSLWGIDKTWSVYLSLCFISLLLRMDGRAI